MDKAQHVFMKYAERNKRKPNRLLLDLAPGALSGTVTSLLLHPLDTLQVRRQTAPPSQNVDFNKPPKLTKPIGKLKAFKSLYKGLGLKLLRNIPTLAIGFGTYGVTKDYLDKKYK
jgi:hypothetical protein